MNLPVVVRAQDIFIYCFQQQLMAEEVKKISEEVKILQNTVIRVQSTFEPGSNVMN